MRQQLDLKSKGQEFFRIMPTALSTGLTTCAAKEEHKDRYQKISSLLMNNVEYIIIV